MRFLAICILCCISSVSCFAQDTESPATLVAFLKPGTHIGIRTYDGRDGFTVTIYSKSDFDIALDARNLELDALAAKYEKVAQARDRTLAHFTESLESRRKTLPSGAEFGEPTASLFIDKHEGLYTVGQIGEDYILVRYGDEGTKRRAFATRNISSIGWHDDLHFNTSVRHIDKTADRTKP
jgi:hypothetical protein